MSQFTLRAGRDFASATLLGAFLATATVLGVQAQAEPAPIAQPIAGEKIHSVHHSEDRIKDLHDKLHITSAQEELWSSVAQVMRDNEKSIRASMMDRKTRLTKMTAIDDLKSFQILADQHSDGLKQLIPAFEALYSNMSPEQQKNADHVFGEHQRHHHM